MAIDGIGASFGGMQAIGVDTFDTVLITGLGPVGIGGIINARFRGARVLAVEPAPWRAALGRALGAEVLDPAEGDLEARASSPAGAAWTALAPWPASGCAAAPCGAAAGWCSWARAPRSSPLR